MAHARGLDLALQTPVVHGLQLVTLPRYLLRSAGTLLEGFETVGDWTGVNGSVAADAVNYKSGTKSLEVTSNVGANGAGRKAVTWDLSAIVGTMRIWVYLTSALATIQNIIIQFHTVSGVDYYQRVFSVANEQLHLGWNYLMIRKEDCTVGGGAPNWNSINFLFVRAQAVAGQVAIASFDDLRLVQNVPTVVFRFDDARDTTYSVAYPILKAHGIRGSVFVVTSFVGGANYMTWAQLLELYNAGWTVGNHTTDHTSLSTLNEADQEAHILGGKTALTAQGLTRHIALLSYPSSLWNADTLTAMAATGTVLGIGNPIATPYEYMPCTRWGLLNDESLVAAITTATVEGWVDFAILNGLCLFLNIDRIDNAAWWTAAKLQTLVDYIYARRTQIFPITIDDYYRLDAGVVRVPRLK